MLTGERQISLSRVILAMGGPSCTPTLFGKTVTR